MSAAPSPPIVRSHIQGEFLSQQLNELGATQDSRPQKAPPEPQQPPIQSDTVPLAPGDYVAEFEGIAYTGWIPPDTTMGVGPSHVVEATNSGFAVYDKAGGLQGYSDFETFFGPVLPG